MDNIFAIVSMVSALGAVVANEVIIDPRDPVGSQKRSIVQPFLVNLRSHAGFIRVSEKQDAYLFFWFFKSENVNEDTPLIVWLQGQPGLSSLYGLFDENGPVCMDKRTYKIKRRKFSWTKKYHILYVDPQVNCGFSYSNDRNETSMSLEETGSRIYVALQEFTQVFPNMRRNDMYLTGMFDSSKYIPLVCEQNLAEGNPTIKLNIKGLMIGGGFTFDRENPDYDDIFYQYGLVGTAERDSMTHSLRLINTYVNSDDWEYAIADIRSSIQKNFQNRSFKTLMDVRDIDPLKLSFAPIIATKEWFRRQIHVGDRPFQRKTQFVTPHTIRSTQQYLSNILRHYKLLLYNGQFDLCTPYAYTQLFLSRLEWDGCEAFYNADRRLWMVNDKFFGYWKGAQNVTHVLVRNAGQMVGSTQPEALFHLLDHFVENKFQ